mgnify:CR=1 FL=1
MKYPNGIKKDYININSHSNRGMNLENDLNDSNTYYLNSNIAVIYKKPTPITINKVDYNFKKLKQSKWLSMYMALRAKKMDEICKNYIDKDLNLILVAALAFGINSGAYVAEIIRAGIESIDKGQMEAGRSLGLNYFQTLKLIILPQAIKNILPAIGNEFITLIKETSVAGYIGVMDLTKASDIIASRTYDYFCPLIIAALIYWCIVIVLTKFLNLFERRLNKCLK